MALEPVARASVGDLLEVAVALPLHTTLTYRDPRREGPAPLGAQVVVRLGPRTVTGFVVGHPERGPARVRPIEAVVDDEASIDPDTLDLARWAAAYYLAPLGEVLRAAMPLGERARAARRVRVTEAGRRLMEAQESDQGPGRGRLGLALLSLDAGERALLRRLAAAKTLSPRTLTREDPGSPGRLKHLVDLGLLEIGDEVRGLTRPRPQAGGVPPSAEPELPADPPALNRHQAEALAVLAAALGRGYAPFVLQGVTGSGKTEVYLRLIAEARRAGQGALVLVPEIALTPQLAAGFRARFGDDVAVLHSALPPAQRRAAWRRLRTGEVGIALGVRSAVFAPVRALGVVVVDEEHDASFKQDDGFCYHARDLALVRAHKGRALAVLGSATPSLETYRNIVLGRFRRLLLPLRANPAAAARPLPPVEVVDLRVHPPGPDGLITAPLAAAVAETLAAGEQAILFLNRRGFSTVVLCRSCGHVLRCPECAVSLTLHAGRDRLLCHYCAHTARRAARCPACGAATLEGLGAGTERVEKVVRSAFPKARVARLDRDTAIGHASLERLLAGVAAREIDILVGTQMVTKGHDFGGVTLVGVLQPDQGMHLPDFRASEQTFQLLEQVAGRAGRADRPGRVVVQTYNPEHPAIEALRRHDYEGFVQGELGWRRDGQYPPFSRMIVLRLDGVDERSVCAAAAEAAACARRAGGAAVRVLGPAEAPLRRLRGRARWQVWLAATDGSAARRAARHAGAAQLPKGVRLAVDVDPRSVL